MFNAAQYKLALGALLLLLATMVAYYPVMRDGGFIWDDDDYVTQNELLRTGEGLWRIWTEPRATPQYYPLVHSTFWIEFQLWGMNPRAYHSVNVVLHAMNAMLVWLVLRRLSLPGAFLAAALFALHPVHVESVAWITERKNVLSGLFYLSALYMYLEFAGRASGDPRRRNFYIAALILFVGALLSKTVTCTLPAVLLLLLWWKRERLTRRDIIPLAPMFAIGIVMGLVTIWLEKHHVGASGVTWDLSPVERILIAGRAVCFYLSKLAVPFQLTFIYPRWEVSAAEVWQFLFPLLVLAGLMVLWVQRGRLGKGPLVAALAFCGTLMPALGFFDVYPMRYSFVADHFQYLASIAPLALLGAVVAPRNRPIRLEGRTIIIAAVVLVLAGLTWRQGRIYRDVETLWRDTVAKHPGGWIQHNNLGVILFQRGEIDAARSLYQQALRNNPDYAESYFNLAYVATLQNRVVEALTYYADGLDRDPRNSMARNNYAHLLAQRGRTQEAERQYRLAIKWMPQLAEPHFNLGVMLKGRGEFDEAEKHLNRTLELEPGHRAARVLLAQNLRGRGSNAEAIQILRPLADGIASPIDEYVLEATVQSGLALLELERFEEARERLQRAGELGAGENIQVCRALARAQVYTHEPHAAAATLQRCLDARPGDVNLAYQLAWIRSTHPDRDVRDGDQAVRLAEPVADAVNRRNPMVLGLLACAYAAADRFDEAIAVGREAVEIASESGDQHLVTDLQNRLTAFRGGKPYLDPSIPTATP